MKKRKAETVQNFVGNGKLTDYKTKTDSWIWKQMHDKKVNNGINVTRDDNFIRFAMKKNRIATKVLTSMSEIKIEKYAVPLSSSTLNLYKCDLCWKLCGDLSGATINQLNIVKELLDAKMDDDLQAYGYNFQIQNVTFLQPYIDFYEKRLMARCRIQFVVNGYKDEQNIKNILQTDGFVFGEMI